MSLLNKKGLAVLSVVVISYTSCTSTVDYPCMDGIPMRYFSKVELNDEQTKIEDVKGVWYFGLEKENRCSYIPDEYELRMSSTYLEDGGRSDEAKGMLSFIKPTEYKKINVKEPEDKTTLPISIEFTIPKEKILRLIDNNVDVFYLFVTESNPNGEIEGFKTPYTEVHFKVEGDIFIHGDILYHDGCIN